MPNRVGKIILAMLVLALTGCATTVHYFPYTSQKLPPKPKDYFVTVYPWAQQRPVVSQAYTVIGKVNITGKVSHGITSQVLENQAKIIARKKGADAIINAKTEKLNYNGVYTVPGQVDYHPVYFSGRHRGGVLYMEDYHPPQYIPYSETVLSFQGELISFNH